MLSLVLNENHTFNRRGLSAFFNLCSLLRGQFVFSQARTSEKSPLQSFPPSLFGGAVQVLPRVCVLEQHAALHSIRTTASKQLSQLYVFRVPLLLKLYSLLEGQFVFPQARTSNIF